MTDKYDPKPYSMSEQEQRLVSDMAKALAIVANSKRQLWEMSNGELVLQSDHLSPSLLQLLMIEWFNDSDPQERAELHNKYTQEFIWATRCTEMFTRMARIAKQKTRHSNFLLDEISKNPVYTYFVGRKSLGYTDQTSDRTEYRAGALRLRIESMATDEIRMWLNKLASAVKFCIEQERGRNDEEICLKVNPKLIEELTLRLAHRAVGAPSANSDGSDELSDKDFDMLVHKYAKISTDLASNALAQTRESLQWLIQLCESTANSAEFRKCLFDPEEQAHSNHVQVTDKVFLNTYNGLEALRRITRQTDTPSELRHELSREGPMSATEDALSLLALALNQSSLLRQLQMVAWHEKYSKLVGHAARQALIKVNRSKQFNKAPFFSMIKKRTALPSSHASKSTVIDMPHTRHVRLAHSYVLTGPQLLLASERIGLTPEQILSNCMIDIVWELVGTYGELPPLTVASRLAEASLEVSRNEAILVIDAISHDVATSGTFVTRLAQEMRQEMIRKDGEYETVVSEASYALRNFSCDDINHFLYMQTPAQLAYTSDLLIDHLKMYLGRKPVRNEKLSSQLMADCGLIVPEAVHYDQHARTDASFSNEVYYPRLSIDLLQYMLPAVCSLRLRTHQRRCMEILPVAGLRSQCMQTLHCGLSTLPKARTWFYNSYESYDSYDSYELSNVDHTDDTENKTSKTRKSSSLHLTMKEYESLPCESRTVLDHLIDNNYVRWCYSSNNARKLEVSSCLFVNNRCM